MAIRPPIERDYTNDDYPPFGTPAADPLPFPQPRIDPCVRITTHIYDPFAENEASQVTLATNVIVPARIVANTRRRITTAHSLEGIWKNTEAKNVRTNMTMGNAPMVPANTPVHRSEGDGASCANSSDAAWTHGTDHYAHYALEHGSDDEEEDPLLDSHPQSKDSELAYWLRRSLREAIYGEVWYAAVLRRRCVSSDHPHPNVEWEITKEACAIKELWLERIRRSRGRNAEDPLKEIAAMQYLKEFHRTLAELEQNNNQDDDEIFSFESLLQTKNLMISTRIMMPFDVLSDDTFLYSIMPFCDGGELFDLLSRERTFSEDDCRRWMREILIGLENLQKAGVCHRDMSLENLITDREGRCMIIDMGMAIRMNYDANDTDLIGVENLRLQRRLLFNTQEKCGKDYCMSPEIFCKARTFDGHAVDLWAVGVILYMMLIGDRPWRRPCAQTNEKFLYFSQGYLAPILREWGINLSDDALHLLQAMMFLNPQDRLSLDQVRAHPWMNPP